MSRATHSASELSRKAGTREAGCQAVSQRASQPRSSQSVSHSGEHIEVVALFGDVAQRTLLVAHLGFGRVIN